MNRLFVVFFLILCTRFSFSQTIGLLQHDAGSLDSGYVLFSPLGSKNIYLIDKCGRQVKTWSSSYRPGQSVYFLPDGNILRPGIFGNTYYTHGGEGGIIEKIDWNNNVVWSYVVSDTVVCQHHDICALPNGNVLVIAWEKKSAAEAIALGRNPNLVASYLWSEEILEIQPAGDSSGSIVWEWHLWDHVVQDYDSTKPNYGNISDNPQLININYGANAQTQDIYHINSIDYNDSLDQIILSCLKYDEIWIIDHSTTTSQAAGHSGGNSGKGGDLIYRWGNPAAYNYGTSADQKLFGQHSVHWIKTGLPHAGNIMLFNNGTGRPGGDYSTVEILALPYIGYNYSQTLPYLPAAPFWVYNNGNNYSLYASKISSGQQLSNGNVLICDGPAGTFTEIDSSGPSQWKYVSPVSNSGILTQGSTPSQTSVFRCIFYPFNYSGFSGHSLTAGMTIEDTNPMTDSCTLSLEIDEHNSLQDISVFPNPVSDICTVRIREKRPSLRILLFNFAGGLIKEQETKGKNQIKIDFSDVRGGIYFLLITTDAGNIFSKKIIVSK